MVFTRLLTEVKIVEVELCYAMQFVLFALDLLLVVVFVWLDNVCMA